MSHLSTSHGTHINTWVTDTHLTRKVYTWVMSHISVSHITHNHGSCHAHPRVMSHIPTTYVTHINDLVVETHVRRDVYTWVMCRVTHINETCHTYEWVMSHISTSHVDCEDSKEMVMEGRDEGDALFMKNWKKKKIDTAVSSDSYVHMNEQTSYVYMNEQRVCGGMAAKDLSCVSIQTPNIHQQKRPIYAISPTASYVMSKETYTYLQKRPICIHKETCIHIQKKSAPGEHCSPLLPLKLLPPTEFCKMSKETYIHI